MPEITDTQAMLASENPNILSDINSSTQTTPMTAPPTNPITSAAATPEMAQASQMAQDLSGQMYGSGFVGALEENRNAAIDELGQYDQMLSSSYNPIPQPTDFVPNPADMASAYAGISGMTASNIGRIAGTVDTTERAYNMAISNVLDRFTNFIQLQQQQRQFEEQMALEKERLQLERQKAAGGGKEEFDMNAAMNALLGIDTETGQPANLMSDAAGKVITDDGMKKQRLAAAMRYARTPAEALQIKEMYDLYYGSDTTKPETLAAATDLRKEFMGTDVVKKFNDAYSSYNRSQSLTPSPAGDQSLLYNYIRLIDPGSFVTGNELATMENAASGSDRIAKLWKKALTGKLPNKQREDLKNQIKQIFEASVDPYRQTVAQYADYADKYGLPRDLVIANTIAPEYGLAVLGGETPFAGGGALAPVTKPKPTLQEIFGPTELNPRQQQREFDEMEKNTPAPPVSWNILDVLSRGRA